MTKKNSIDFILNTIFIVLAISSLIVSYFQVLDIPAVVIIVIIAVCLIGYIYVAVRKYRRNKEDIPKEYEEGSKEFFTFFSNWYSKPGELSIFCTDLDWMKKTPFNLIDDIRKKGKDCTLYLRQDVSNDTREVLEKADVRISPNHNNLLTRHRFSLREDADATYLIISEKKHGDGENEKVVIKQEDNSSNPYIITVVKDLLVSMNKNEKK